MVSSSYRTLKNKLLEVLQEEQTPAKKKKVSSKSSRVKKETKENEKPLEVGHTQKKSVSKKDNR